MIKHWAYFEYPEGYDDHVSEHWHNIILTQPCGVYQRNKYNGGHLWTMQFDLVNCDQCRKLPEFWEAKKRDGLKALNDLDLD